MIVSEVSVLEPKDPSIENWDDWPTYCLKSINITSESSALPVSLLTAHNDCPVKVIGHLDTIDSEQSHLIRDPKYKTKIIELTDITTYAFAEFEDGSHGFWAAGKAGWFELKDPLASFQPTFDMMNEAASMFYMLVDKSKRARKSQSNYTARHLDNYANLIFKEYLSHRKNNLRRADVDEVRAGFHEHREFLITSMLEGQEGLDWQSSPMLRYFKNQFPDQYIATKTRIFPPDVIPETALDISTKSDAPKRKDGAKRGRKPKDDKHKNMPLPETPSRPEPGTERDSNTSGDEPEDRDAVSGQVNVRKRKSILQPTGSKYSKKAAGRRRSLSFIDRALADNGDGMDAEDDTPAPQDSSPLPPVNHHEAFQLGSHIRTNERLSSSDPSTYTYPSIKYQEIKVVSYDVPSSRPQGPGDLWTCEFSGCSYSVHEGSSSSGIARIKAHFQTHAHQAREKIELAYQESRPYLPVDNLVRRIQALAPQSNHITGQELSERSPPIKLRF